MMQISVKSRPEIIKRYYIHATGHLPLIHRLLERKDKDLDRGGRVIGLIFAGYVSLASQSPYPLWSIRWPIIDPISVTFGQICNFCDPNLATFYLCIYLILNESKNTLLYL